MKSEFVKKLHVNRYMIQLRQNSTYSKSRKKEKKKIYIYIYIELCVQKVIKKTKYDSIFTNKDKSSVKAHNLEGHF